MEGDHSKPRLAASVTSVLNFTQNQRIEFAAAAGDSIRPNWTSFLGTPGMQRR
jgi:hypothetical protein